MLAKSSEGRIKESEVLKIIKSSLTVENESSKNTSVSEMQKLGLFKFVTVNKKRLRFQIDS